MKKRLIKLIAVLTALSLVIGSSAFAAEDSRSFRINSETEMSQTALEKENEANEAYTNMLDSFRNSGASKLSVQSEYAEKQQSGYTVDGIPAEDFPDYYAGAYINQNHELVVLVTDNAASVRRMAKAQAQGSNLNFREAVHSYADLVRCMDEITSYWNNGNTEFSALKYAYIDDYGNRIVVGSQRMDDEYMSFLQRELKYFDLIEFCECGDVDGAITLESTTVNCFTTIHPSTVASPAAEPSEQMSFGFKAKKVINGVTKYGFVTAKHAIDVGEYAVCLNQNSIYRHIGKCIYSVGLVESGSVDAAFVEHTNTSEFQLSGTFVNTDARPNVTRTTSQQYKTLSQGSTIYKCGAVTRETQGNVASVSFTINVGTTIYCRDLGLANYYSQGGDSGGLVYSVNSTNGTVAYPAGIHNMSISETLLHNSGQWPTIGPCETDSAYRGYCKITNVLDKLNVSIVP